MTASHSRALARTSLLVIITMLLAYVLLTTPYSFGLPGTAPAQAQATPSGFTIEWVNPDSDSNTEISAQAKEGLSGTPFYHLVAWVNRLPADPFVEFCVDDCSPTSERITDEQDGAGFVEPDTWQHNWTNLPADTAPNTTITLTARFFSGGTLLDTDTVSVTVNNAVEPGPPNSVSEGVEITDPVNGEAMGFYQPPGEDTYIGVMDIATSAGATVVEAKYAISAPGTDPSWKSCGFEGVDDTAEGLRCELASGDTPEEVNTVAAVAYDDPSGSAPAQVQAQFREGGDGHRIDGYSQFPEGLVLEFLNAQGTAATGDTAQATAGQCSTVLRATVTDQNDEAVPAVNVDLHAQGPSDDIRFVEVDAIQRPDQGGHTSEAAGSDACDGSTSGNQGDHDSPSDDDTKHVESADDTNDSGQFSAKFFHRAGADIPGDTQITGWADLDGDDVFCSQEPNDSASIGWGQSAPSPSALPAGTEACTLPGQSPSPTTSSPSPSGTTSSPTPTESESPSPTPTQERVATNLTIKYARPFFTGKVGSSERRCRSGRVVTVKKKKPGRDPVIGRDKSNRRGGWSVRERRARGRYYATVAVKRFVDGSRSVTCQADRSPTIRAR